MKQTSLAHAAAFSLLASLTAPAAVAAGLANGDFATGDYTGWTLDTDGNPGAGSDFSVPGAPGP